jgi:hypothetical protein
MIRLELIKEHLVSIAGQVLPLLGVTTGSEQSLAGVGLWLAKAKKAGIDQAIFDLIEQKLNTLLGASWRELAQFAGLDSAMTQLASVAQDSVFLQALQDAKTQFPIAELPILSFGSVYQDQVIDQLLARFLAEKAELTACPQINGQALENSAMSRLGWQDQVGVHPVWARQLARVVDMAQQAMFLFGERAGAPVSGCVQPMPTVPMGLSWVETARGRLFHLAHWDRHGVVLDYAIIAPTEWNFHPQGIVQNWLQGWQSAGVLSAEAFEREAMALGQLIDPCVPIVMSKGENDRA